MFRQSKSIKRGPVEQAHVRQVMDGEHGAWASVVLMHQSNRRAGVPVVAVQHVGAPTHACLPEGKCRRSARQQHEAFGIVFPGLAAGVVIGIACAFTEGWVTHQPHRDPGAGQDRLLQHDLGTGNHWTGDLDGCLQGIEDIAVTWQQDAHVNAQIGQGGRQGAGHVREPAGLHQRIHLAGRK